jgi:hypothetical protein
MANNKISGYIKLLVVGLAAAILLATPIAVLAATNTTFSVSAPSQPLAAGSHFLVNIQVQPAGALAGAQFSLTFDPTKIRIDNVTEGNLFNQNGANTYFDPGQIDNNSGTLTAVASSIATPGQTVSTAGTLAVIAFTAIGSGSSALSLSNVIAGNINGQALAVNYSGGQITINKPPVFNTINAQTVTIGSTLSFSVTAIDSDSSTLTYSAINVPAGATFTPATRTFNWTPALGQSGSYTVVFKVTDGLNTSQSQVTIQVAKLTPVFSNLNSPRINAQDTSTTLTGNLKAGSYVPTGSISILLNGQAYTTPLDFYGNFVLNLETNNLQASGSPYIINYQYSGDANYKSALSNTNKLIVVGQLDHITVNPAGTSSLNSGGGITSNQTSGNTTVKAGKSLPFVAYGYDSQNNLIDGLTFRWLVTDLNAGSISSAGVFTAGTKPAMYNNLIQALADGFAGTTSVYVIPSDLDHMTISPNNLTMAAGSSQSLNPQAYDVYGNVISGISFHWSVIDARAGQINVNNIFTASNVPGSYPNAIKVETANIYALASVTVKTGDLDHITISPPISQLVVNTNQLFSAQGFDKYNNAIAGLTYNWSMVNQTAGSINSSGLFTAGKTAATYSNAIKVAAGNKSGSASVVVKVGALDHITVSPNDVSLGTLKTLSFSAQGFDAYENPISGLVYTWKLNNTTAGKITTSGTFTAGSIAGSYPELVQATSGGKTGVAKVNIITPDFTIVASDADKSVPAGSSVKYAITSYPSYGFNSSVSLKVQGVPGGASATFAPSSTKTASVLVVKTSTKTLCGTYKLTVTGTSGKLVRTIDLNLTVTAPPTFTLNARSLVGAATTTKSVSYNVDVIREPGFTSSVTLNVSGLPGRSTATFTPKTTASSSVLKITYSSFTPKGTYDLTINGSGGGMKSTTTIKLTIN